MRSKLIEIDTKLSSKLAHYGVPTKLVRGSNFKLSSVLIEIELENRVVSKKTQLENYSIALEDDPGWFAIIQSPTTLNNAKFVAMNIANAYLNDDLSFAWVSSFFKDPPPEKNLYILDALFEDDNPSKRSRIYEILTGINDPSASVILLSRSVSVTNSVNQIGLKPHLAFSIGNDYGG